MIKMDTDAVRAMSSGLRQTADSMDSRFASIKSAVESAGWQSQAREEFIMQLEMLSRSTSQSTEVMRLMARASDSKADQWEAIANVFNGPFYYLEGVWNSVVSFFSGIGNSIWNAITSIKLPSLPTIVLPSLSGAAIIGGISSIIPKWEWNPPDWWPFNSSNNFSSNQKDVLGAREKNVQNESNIPYDEMSWKEKAEELNRLHIELSELKQGDSSLDKELVAKKIAEIDEQIRDIEETLEEVKSESSKLINKIMKQDGKSLSEKYESIQKNYEQQLEKLNELKEQYQMELNDINRIEEIKEQIGELSSTMNGGIQDSGKTDQWIRNDFAGCTNYVAEKRNVSRLNDGHPGFPKDWMGQAKGYYDTGKIPVEGSIAVFDQSAEVFHHDNRVFTADKVNGHVGIVEEIKIVEGGYEIRMSHAGVVYENGNPVSGTYAKYQDLIFEVPFEGLEDIGFIYD